MTVLHCVPQPGPPLAIQVISKVLLVCQLHLLLLGSYVSVFLILTNLGVKLVLHLNCIVERPDLYLWEVFESTAGLHYQLIQKPVLQVFLEDQGAPVLGDMEIATENKHLYCRI